MSPRPQRRRSSLSGESPIAPAPATEPAPAAEPAPVSPPASAAPVAPVDASPSLGTPGQGKGYATSATTVPAPDASDAAAPSKPTSKYPPKVSFYQDRADTDRIRGAIMHTIPWEGTRTLSQFLSGAAMKEVERLEAQYNNGQPFPKVGARELPQGRPMGE